MNLRRFHTLLSALALSATPGISLAADNPGSHQHGHAQLQMAIDGTRIELFLVSPAANLVGFEQAPATEAQREKVREVTAWARQTPMITHAERPCTVTDAALQATWSHGEDEHDHNHDHDHGHQHEGHADLEISQTLDCPGLTASTELETTLMAQFPAMEQLEVQWVGPAGQGGARLSPEQVRFSAGH